MIDDLLKTLNRVAGPRGALVAVGLAATLVIWGLAQWGLAPRYIPVAAGLTIERMGEATQLLDDSDIEYRLERGGKMLTVAEEDAPEARVALAGEGLTGTVSSLGLEIFDQPAWGMTDFTQRVNLRRGLEGDLERTIRAMRGIENADVHLALSESTFLEDDAGEATVKLRLTGGTAPAAGVVEGIQSLVANAAPGLSEDKVAILDDRGRLLSSPVGMSGAGVTAVQLKVRGETERYLEQKAESMVAQMVGRGNATVQIAAELNFDQIDRTTQAIDPDQQLLVSENRAEITPGTDAQGAGEVKTDTRFEATRSVETVSRAGARIDRLTVAVVVADRRIEQPDGTFTTQPRTPQELQQVERLVANAVGLSGVRGDEISVVGTAFDVPAEVVMDEPGPNIAGMALAFYRPVVVLIALGVVLFLGLRVISTVQTLNPRPAMGRLSLSPEAALAAAGASDAPALAAPANAPPMQQPKSVELSDPAMTARVLRSWMAES